MPPRVERARLTAIKSGRYLVGIDFIDACGSGYDAVPIRLALDGIGTARSEVSGTARPHLTHVWPIDIVIRSPPGRVVSAGAP